MMDAATLQDRSQIQSETANTLLLGGLSIITCMAFWLFVPKSSDLALTGQAALVLSFVINYPHFLSSYMLLYNDFRKNIFSSVKYVWASIICPMLLIGTLGYALLSESAALLGYGLNVMFFLVGWHYMKQIFGVVIVTSAAKRVYYTKSDRNVLLVNLFAIWGVSFFNSQIYLGNHEFWGIKFGSFGISQYWAMICYTLFISTLLYLVVSFAKRYFETGETPQMTAVVAIASLYVWYLPMFYHPHFAYFIPFFHSLQYMVFVWSFKKNQISDRVEEKPNGDRRKEIAFYLIGFMVISVILGALAFEIIPKSLDKMIGFTNRAMGTNPFVVAFILFINIHHYFIDNTIWKSTNAEVKKYLFKS